MFNLIADSATRFSDFAPYAAAIALDGTVAFWAAETDGGEGIFLSDGKAITPVAETAAGPFRRFCSHPALQLGLCCFYAETGTGDQGVYLAANGQLLTLADTTGPFRHIGPLGPTLNAAGTVAFRAETKTGAQGLFTGRQGRIAPIAETGGRFAAFQGLPVINNQEEVAFCADLSGGGQAICLARGNQRHTVADTSGPFSAFGSFPGLDGQGMVAFSATFKSGGQGIFTAAAGRLEPVADTRGAFASFRGALISQAGRVFILGTPQQGQLGIFSGPDPIRDKLLALGDTLFGSTIVDFALNAVSLNDAGQIAVRVRLAGGRQLLLRTLPRP